jgi:hypothetical protein
MDVDPTANSIRPKKQRPRLAVALVAGLSLLAVAWGLKVYYLPQYRSKHVAGLVQDLNAQHLLHDGDIIFQTSRSAQGRAIQSATHSIYSHCGLIFRADTGDHEWLVLEAVQPVKWTPLTNWIAHGEGGHFTIKRCGPDPELPEPIPGSLKIAGENYLGRDYDPYFGWNDDRMYCSELVWKVYHNAIGIDLGEPQSLKEFDLSDPLVAQLLKARYGNNPPGNEPVISPARIFDSDLLQTVVER